MKVEIKEDIYYTTNQVDRKVLYKGVQDITDNTYNIIKHNKNVVILHNDLKLQNNDLKVENKDVTLVEDSLQNETTEDNKDEDEVLDEEETKYNKKSFKKNNKIKY